jgi:hypothetical protein
VLEKKVFSAAGRAFRHGQKGQKTRTVGGKLDFELADAGTREMVITG